MSSENAPRPVPEDAGDVVARSEEQAIDSVPAAVREAARRAFRARERDALLLGLVHDTLVDEPAGAPGPRRLGFTGLGLPGQVEVTVLEHGDGPAITLVLECPWDDTRLERVECGGRDLPVQQQAPRRWAASAPDHGLFRAALRKGDALLHTAWVRV